MGVRQRGYGGRALLHLVQEAEVIALVAAMDEARLIGVNGRLPWHSPADMAQFRALTMGKVVVMGRKTYESIGRPLEGRENVVASEHGRNPRKEGLWWSRSLGPSVMDRDVRGMDVFIIGGASVYAQALPLASRLYITRIRHTFPAGEGAVYFPEWDGFRMVGSKHREADAANPWPMDFEQWERG